MVVAAAPEPGRSCARRDTAVPTWLRTSLLVVAAAVVFLDSILGPGLLSASIVAVLVVASAAVGAFATRTIPAHARAVWLLALGSVVLLAVPQVMCTLGGDRVRAGTWWVEVAGLALLCAAVVLRVVQRDGNLTTQGLVGPAVLAGLSLAAFRLVQATVTAGPRWPGVLGVLVGLLCVGAVATLLAEPPVTAADRCLAVGSLFVAVGFGVQLALPPLGALVCVLGGVMLALGPVRRSVPITQHVAPAWRSWVLLGLASLALPVTQLVLAVGGQSMPVPSALAELALLLVWAGLLRRMVRDRARHQGLVTELAETDSITGLPNRHRFMADVAAALEATARDTVSVTVVLVAMENFAELRERLGQATAEQIQVAAARRIAPDGSEAMSVAHVNGDVFGLLFDVMSHDRATMRAQHLVDALREPLELPQLSLSVGAVVGLASGQGGSIDAAGLVAAAELALAAARGPAGPIVRYAPELQRRDALAAQLVGELSDAITRGEVIVYFQPQLDLNTGQVTGAEALVRWMHPSLGLLGPSAFVPAAEATGSIRVITLHVLDQALYWCARWSRAGRPMNVSVNLSARDLLHARLVDDVREALARYGLPASRLELEVTETMAMADVTLSQRVLTDLARLGVTISIDDYGTGYGSLAYLQQLPVRRLKIDRSFVSRILDDEASTAIVRSTIELAAHLGLDTVAEGVEDDATVQRLREFGCTSVQGFGMAAPMSPEGFERAIWRLEHRLRPAVASRSVAPGQAPAASRPGLTRPTSVDRPAPVGRANPFDRPAYPSVAEAYHQLTDPSRRSGDVLPHDVPAALVQQPAAGAPSVTPSPAGQTSTEPAPVAQISVARTPIVPTATAPAAGPQPPRPRPQPRHAPVSSPSAARPRVGPGREPGVGRPVGPDDATPSSGTPSAARFATYAECHLSVVEPSGDQAPARRSRRELRQAPQTPPGGAGSVGGMRAAAASERTTGVDPA